jgi:2-amino-4-hydroxy-6-hydroxymethyldihydropteridine diphosphokinase
MTRHLHAVTGEQTSTPAACTATLGLGSNIGDKAGNIDRAIELLAAAGDVRIVAISRKYQSPPWGDLNQDWFVNACVGVDTQLTPHELLARCQTVEAQMGRVRLKKWGPRVIDVDILTYGEQDIRDADLVVPHPLIAERPFVAIPLHDIAPGLVIRGRKLSDLIAALRDTGVTLHAKP